MEDNLKEVRGFNEMQLIKRRMFAMRNGALADSLRRSGVPYRIIFGVNLPQLVEIANENPKNVKLAEKLWANSSTRESLLLAPMLYPVEQMDMTTAHRWATSVASPEVADVLCHRLLRHLSFADELADDLVESEVELVRYCGLRLLMNRFPNRLEWIRQVAEKELARGVAMTESLSRMMVEEASFMLSSGD